MKPGLKMFVMSVIRLAALAVLVGTLAVPAASAAEGTPAPRRAPPLFDSFRAGLAFPAEPGPQDIFRAHLFQEPLVPVGGEPSSAENAALAGALMGYSKRQGPDDFSSLTAFLKQYPETPWRAALLTDLGLEYYHTAHYSLALEAWQQAWLAGKDATDLRGKAVADRAAGELACMYARLGRMDELDALLKSLEDRPVIGAATERIAGARDGLWNMRNRPGISFRCGPMALRCIRLATHARGPGDAEIFNSASTQQGFSLPQVAELSRKAGLNYQMAFRGKDAAFVAPSVVHWKVGHYAAIVGKEGGLYHVQDPTFGTETWATKEALESETSGYFLIPPGPLPEGWREVAAGEGGTVWGKGGTAGPKLGMTGPKDPKTHPQPCQGMAVPAIHLMAVNLNLTDEPVGYSPPVGPPVHFTVRYNHRDAFQPANFSYANFGPKWTCDWISYITDTPSNHLADVTLYVQGGGARTFTGFDTNTQSYSFQQYDETRLRRTGPSSYELLSGDGSKLVFSQSDGSVGSSRNVFLTQVMDPAGNAVTLAYDANLRLAAITDALCQVTTLAYANASDIYKITEVTDPFGRSATFDYDGQSRLARITDVIGLTSQFIYLDTPVAPPRTGTNYTDFIQQLITPYGTNYFLAQDSGDIRVLEITYPDNSRERVEFNETNSAEFGPLSADPAASVPLGMSTVNDFLVYRNTYWWSRTGCALGYRDPTKARLFHWLHDSDTVSCSGILESTKEPLEGRVWYDYAGQPFASYVGDNNRPTHAGRVLDDGSTQLYTYTYNGFGNVTNMIDPVGRTFSYVYATNGIDLLEVRQTRGNNNDLLFKATYNSQHLPLTQTDAAGQTTTFTYNARGQRLTETDAKGGVVTYAYDTNGYRLTVDGPLPGTIDVTSATYDAFGRTRTRTSESGYVLTFDYDALDRLVKITHPDGTFEQITYDRLDPSVLQDRAGRQTLFEYDRMRQLERRTDPLNRTTLFEWCSCGDLKSLTDPMGRTTTWNKDVQGRVTAKTFADGSQIAYLYENTTSRLQQKVDEKQQITQFAYYPDDTVRAVIYPNAAIPTPAVSYTYDPDYRRMTSMTDGIGTTTYHYVPVSSPATLGAGRLAGTDGPLPNAAITYAYDELGRRTQTAINGIVATKTFDAASRVLSESNALGNFNFTYDGGTFRLLSQSYPNGLAGAWSYQDNLHDNALQQITYSAGATLVSRFIYGNDIAAGLITNWLQQAGAQAPSIYTFGYDAADQLLWATVSNSGAPAGFFAYSYDPAGNRLAEQIGSVTNTANYNMLNQLSAAAAGAGSSISNEWDAARRLAAINAGAQRTELAYDGLDRLSSIRELQSGSQVSYRRLLWCNDDICEERDASGANITKRYFRQGVQIEAGPTAGSYYYTRDHLGSIRELVDGGGNVRTRYSYDPFGRRTRVAGDLDTDFGFTGIFWSPEAGLAITRFRAYNPGLGRWLSRDWLRDAEMEQGPNLYAYAANNAVNVTDPLGLCCEKEAVAFTKAQNYYFSRCLQALQDYHESCMDWFTNSPDGAVEACAREQQIAQNTCDFITVDSLSGSVTAWKKCAKKPCKENGGVCRPDNRRLPFALPNGGIGLTNPRIYSQEQ